MGNLAKGFERALCLNKGISDGQLKAVGIDRSIISHQVLDEQNEMMIASLKNNKGISDQRLRAVGIYRHEHGTLDLAAA